MTRWDYDTVFYRVFCTALLVVALTFTVILTNVFIDIDGLLSKKNKANTDKLETVKAVDGITTNIMADDMYDYKDYTDYYGEVGERTKRSLETQDYAFRIKDSNMKKAISNHLAALLDDLDKEESSNNNKVNELAKDHQNINEKYTDINVNEKKNYKTEFELVDKKLKDDEFDINKHKRDQQFENKDINIELNDDKNKREEFENTEEIKHIAMHNIILQGIIGHMELGDVYRRVHALFHNSERNKDNFKEDQHLVHEKLFFNELTNCKQLQKEIGLDTPEMTTPQIEKEIRTVKPSGRNVMIKTIIDINTIVNEKTNQEDLSKENVNGIVKMIYNGKTLKFRRVDESTTTKSKLTVKNDKLPTIESNIESGKDVEYKTLHSDKKETNTYVPNAFMNKIISEYLKRLSKEDDGKKITTKRLKRHIKIRYENEHSSKITTEAPNNKENKGDDELYVEIETHFDSKGMKGEKKKKIIRDLIEKIQKAIHSGKEVKKKKHKHLHVKKRTQNPLDNEKTASFVNKLSPLNNLVHRHMDPISKSVPMHDKLPHVSDDNGEDWRRRYYGPGFLTASKAINSAEISEVDVDYNKILNNGIPQRLQTPLNTETSDSVVNNRQEQGSSQFVVRDIAGSGFSIGFNQYVDEPPDAESMKLFSGIENIIQTYHQKYDDGATVVNADNTDNSLKQEIIEEPVHYEYPPPEKDDHLIVRRSIKNFKEDYHSNEYKVIFNKNFLNYNNYQDVYNRKDKSNTTNRNELFDDSIFNKELKPAEIFSLADMLERQKRSLNVKKISNLKNKKKFNRYINTKSMASKNIFKQNKRSKRQIGKIRIIAKDISENHKHPSNEDIFVFSDEKIFADRAMIKEVETPVMGPMETNHGEHFNKEHFNEEHFNKEHFNEEHFNKEHFNVINPQHPTEDHYDVISPQISENHFDIISPQKVTENHYDIISPYIFEAPSDSPSIFTRKSRHNSLMSKYPHIFMEEISKSKEDFPDSQMYENIEEKMKEPTTQVTQIVEMPQPQYIPEKQPYLQEVMDYPPEQKSNYKVTVKVMPKNNTSLNSGFKEIHTSINKSYNKNGLLYTSLVNVSEISKVEKMNKTKNMYQYAHPSVKKLKLEQMKIKNIIQQHKYRIEQQLAHLNREKDKLDRMDIGNAEILKDARDDIDIAIPNNTEKHITKEDIGRMKIEPTTVQPTTEYVQPTTEDSEKLKIIETIERNEKLTNEILQKIDKNTNILQLFLDKLITKMEAKEQDAKIPDKEENRPSAEKPKTNETYNNLQQILFNQMATKNMTGIPFIYAFQQPYKMPNNVNNEVPIASVVYQGHIHTQTIKPEVRRTWKENKDWNHVKPINEIKNSSKFFIDDIEEYKVLPIVGKTEFSSNITKV